MRNLLLASALVCTLAACGYPDATCNGGPCTASATPLTESPTDALIRHMHDTYYAPYTPPAGPVSVPMKDSGDGTRVVTLRIGGAAGLCTVDSGAFSVMIPRKVFDMIQGTTPVVPFGSTDVTTADGNTQSLDIYAIDDVSLTGSDGRVVALEHVKVTVGATDDTCLIGQSFLSRFSRVALNYSADTLEVTP